MIYNLGSINSDFFFSVPALPVPGETVAATELNRDLGGKGTNMSIAAARAGAHVLHIGAVGDDGDWAIEALQAAGVETKVAVLPKTMTGQAVILRDAKGENAIVTLSGANGLLGEAWVTQALDAIGPDDVLLLQNETNLGPWAARMASASGAHVLYAAAPFASKAVQEVLPFVDTLVLNAVEMAQLQAALRVSADELGVDHVVMTEGAEGATLLCSGSAPRKLSAPGVKSVDTTGAGDTLAGYLAAGLDFGRPIHDALENAIFAASIMTTKKGTASAIPFQHDVDAFRLKTP
ncbi:MAG: ribokinase [Pseudomonadota bacterium]